MDRSTSTKKKIIQNTSNDILMFFEFRALLEREEDSLITNEWVIVSWHLHSSHAHQHRLNVLDTICVCVVVVELLHVWEVDVQRTLQVCLDIIYLLAEKDLHIRKCEHILDQSKTMILLQNYNKKLIDITVHFHP